ncbi:MAG: MCE family protein, partial [Kiritimatiellae bacterium]|nr:MCE family protein [Kiritimatiellia bacterium]
MSSNRKDSFSEAIVGVFMLAVLALLVYFTIVISGVDVLGGRSKVEARVTFTDVGGLKEQDNVMYRGTKVGKIEKIVLGESDLTVVMEIDKDVILR